MIDRHMRSYNRLQWQLTLSHALVTVLVTLVIETCLLAATMLGIIDDLAHTLPAQLERLTPSLVPYLAARAPDRDRLRTWLQVVSGLESTGETGTTMGPPDVSVRAVLDSAGDVLASTSSASPASASPGASQPDALRPADLNTADSQVVVSALAGHPAGVRARVTPRMWSLTAAAPVRSPEGAVLGALYVKASYDDNRVQIMNVQALLLPGLIFAALVAGLAAALSGFLNARSLTRRLERLAERADHWSQGNFDVTVDDTSSDELGDLARHFDRMARQISSLLQTRQELAVLQERNRLARDLHDSVKQQVFAAAMLVSAAQSSLPEKPGAAQARLAEAAELTHEVQQELELLIRELHPAAMGTRGLNDVLRDYVAAWSRQQNVPADFQNDGACWAPAEMQQALFRVAQEALSNVARHSRARSVAVSLMWSPNEVALRVADDGVGFDPSMTGCGLGMQSMRERVEGLGGRLVVRSGDGTGTEVTATCRPAAPGEKSQ